MRSLGMQPPTAVLFRSAGRHRSACVVGNWASSCRGAGSRMLVSWRQCSSSMQMCLFRMCQLHIAANLCGGGSSKPCGHACRAAWSCSGGTTYPLAASVLSCSAAAILSACRWLTSCRCGYAATQCLLTAAVCSTGLRCSCHDQSKVSLSSRGVHVMCEVMLRFVLRLCAAG